MHFISETCKPELVKTQSSKFLDAWLYSVIWTPDSKIFKTEINQIFIHVCVFSNLTNINRCLLHVAPENIMEWANTSRTEGIGIFWRCERGPAGGEGKGMYEALLQLLKGWGWGLRKKAPSMGEESMDVFWNYTLIHEVSIY